jgi:hypothetical protein
MEKALESQHNLELEKYPHEQQKSKCSFGLQQDSKLEISKSSQILARIYLPHGAQSFLKS